MQTIAAVICEKLTKKLIRKCQAQPLGLLQHSGLRDFWDEICVGWRTDSVFQDIHLDYLRKWLLLLVKESNEFDLWMVWLQTEGGEIYARASKSIVEEDLAASPEDQALLEPEPSRSPSEWPIKIAHIVEYILDEFVINQCMNYENKRIRKYVGDG